MTHKQKTLAAEFLRLMSDELSNHGCNDWNWPDDWTEADRLDFIGAIDCDQTQKQEYVNGRSPPDWLVASTLADILEGEE